MGSYTSASTSQGDLMSFLMKERSRFESEDEFNDFAIAEVRRFINDLRSINIELSLRPNYGGTPLSRLSATEKLSEH